MGATENNTRLRSTEQLVTRARDDVNAGAKRGGRGLLPRIGEHPVCKQSARALVLVQQQPVLMRQRGKLRRGNLLVEALDTIVGRMDFQDHRRAGRNGTSIIIQMRAVGRAHFDKLGTRSRHDVGDAEAAAHLDQLAAAHDDLFAARMRGKYQQHRRGIIVDNQGVLRPRERAQQARGMFLAATTCTGRDVILERAVSAGDIGHRLHRCGSERSAAQIGVNHNARRVDGGTQGRQRQAVTPPLDSQGELALIPSGGAGANRRALGIELGVNRLAHNRVARIARSLHDRPLRQQLVDSGNGAQAVAHLGRHGFAVAHGKPFDMFNKKQVPFGRHRPKCDDANTKGTGPLWQLATRRRSASSKTCQNKPVPFWSVRPLCWRR